ncbi:hypothetical protein KAI52_00090 [Candidatus Parcubacteria bacterium]|nr:hypothetical protein [Candidatus Parcubacteria bacterium]
MHLKLDDLVAKKEKELEEIGKFYSLFESCKHKVRELNRESSAITLDELEELIVKRLKFQGIMVE